MAANQFFIPYRPAYDGTGLVVPGAQFYFTLAGTNTPSAPFTTTALSTPYPNPVKADAAGKLPPIYLDAAKNYRVRVYERGATAGVSTPLEEYDPYVPGAFDEMSLDPVAAAAAASATAAAEAAAEAAASALESEGFATKGDPGGDATDVGLFSDIPDLTVSAGIKKIHTHGRSALDVGAADYVAGTAPTTRSGATTANARNFVLSKEQVITTDMFYEPTDPDYQNAIQAALDYAEAVAVDPVNVWYKAGPKIVIPAHSSEYLVHDTIEPKHIGIIEGEDIGWFDSHATRLRMTTGGTMWRFQDIQTSGASGTAADHLAPTGSVLRNLHLTGYLGTVSTEAENHAIHSRTRVRLERLGGQDWQGDFIHINADVGVGQSNASFAQVDTVRAFRIRNGVYLDGGDANVCDIRNIDIPYARQWCIWDSSFLGNSIDGCHAANGGAILQPGYTPSVVSYSGNQYAVVAGQEVGASTNAPSGTTADNQWWYYVAAGGVSAPLNVPAWVSGITVRAGGSYYVDSGNAPTILKACYSEGGQGPMQLPASGLAVAIGGTHAVPPRGVYVASHNGRLTAYCGVAAEDITTGNYSAIGAGNAAVDPILRSRNTTHIGGISELALQWNPVTPKLLFWTNWKGDYSNSSVVYQISMNATPAADAPWGQNLMNFPTGFGFGGKPEYPGTAAPTGAMPNGGNWPVGARIVNVISPTVGQPKAWICTAAGSPGTWVSEGNL